MKTKILLISLIMAIMPIYTNAQTWNELGPGGFSAGEAYGQRIAYDGNTTYAAYIDQGDGNRLSVKKYNGTDWEFVGSQGFTPQIYSFDFVIENGQFYIAFSTSNKKISVMNLMGGTWVYSGDTVMASGQTVRLAVQAGIPYIAYTDWENNQKVSVKKTGSTGWEYVGTAGFSPFTLPGVLDIEVSGSSIYIAARDDSYPYDLKSTVMKYDGSQWDTVGIRGFSGSTLNTYNPLAIYNGTPYVVAWNEQSRGVVYTFNGTNWVTVGNPFSTGTSYYDNLKVSPQGNLYLAYTDAGEMNRAELKKLNGTTWESVGDEVSKANAKYLDIAFDNNETPFMIFQDSWYLRKTTVMTFGEVVDGIKNHSEFSNVSIYPNPATNWLTVRNNSNNLITEVIIFNQIGQQIRVLKSQILSGSVLEMDISNLSTGIYFIQTKSDTETLVSKFVKE